MAYEPPLLCHMNHFYWGWGWSLICWPLGVHPTSFAADCFMCLNCPSFEELFALKLLQLLGECAADKELDEQEHHRHRAKGGGVISHSWGQWGRLVWLDSIINPRRSYFCQRGSSTSCVNASRTLLMKDHPVHGPRLTLAVRLLFFLKSLRSKFKLAKSCSCNRRKFTKIPVNVFC